MVKSVRLLTTFIGISILVSYSASAAKKDVRTDVRVDPSTPFHIGEEFYPDASKRAQEEGRCVVRVRVTKEGLVIPLNITESSGYPRLDEATMNAVAGAHVIPATLNGQPIETTSRIPIVWILRKPRTEPNAVSSASDTSTTPHNAAIQETHPTHTESANVYIVAAETLETVQLGCDAFKYKLFQMEIICVKKGIASSRQLSEHGISSDLMLYMLTAENLSDEASRHGVSFTAARVNLQKAFIAFRDQMNRDASEVAAREDTARRDAEAQQGREHERQMRQAQSEAAQARLASQAQEAIRSQEEQRRAEVELCFSEVMKRNESAGENLSWLDSNEVMRMQSDHMNTRATCENDPTCFLGVPIPRPRPPPSMTTCQEFGQQFTCVTNQ